MQRQLLVVVGCVTEMDHDDPHLDAFCDPRAEKDVFNECHDAGWLRTSHDVDTSTSLVRLTPDGRAALKQTEAGQ